MTLSITQENGKYLKPDPLMRMRPGNLKEYLKDKARKDDINDLRRGFEIIGDIMIIDLPGHLLYLKDDIVEWVKMKHRHIKTILRKTGETKGKYRIAEYEILYGSDTETVAREHGCRFKVDVRKAYYTSKLSGERARIARKVRKGERVLVMFAGVGPYAIVIARLSEPSEVVGVELNPEAVRYFQENIRMNRVDGVVKAIQGDVREVVPKLEGRFDRIVMPAPYNADEFFHLALPKIKTNGFIHFYTFAGEEEVEDRKEWILQEIERRGFSGSVQEWRECGNFAPRVNRYVFDIFISEAPL